MVNLVYRAQTVGPVCNKLHRESPNSIRVFHENDRIPTDGTLVRWGATVAGSSQNTINSAASVSLARDKKRSRQQLRELAPPTWYRLEDIPSGTSVVIRPHHHFAGRKFFVCKTREEMQRAVRRCGGTGKYYATKLVNKANEYRVFVLNGRVVAVSERFGASPDAIAWNLAMGGRLTNVKYKQWNIPVCVAAIHACERLGLDWGAIDIATDRNGQIVVFEANTAPGLRNPYTIQQIARSLSWADQNKVKGIDLNNAKTWKQIVHPALLR